MINKEKVKIMTKLATYEKNIGKEDFKINDYFKRSYVSYHNFETRVGVTIALLIILAVDFANIFTENLNSITDYNFVGLGIRYLIIWVIAMVAYTLLSTFVYRRRYQKAEKRINEYKALLDKLESFK